jgi:transcriptional regulator with XRE-family HTH domain
MPAPIEPFYANLGRRIQDLRATRGVTQEELGSRLETKMTRASIANIESGKQRVYAHTLIEIARALDTSLHELLPEQSGETKRRAQRAPATERFASELASKLQLRPEEVRELVQRIGVAQRELEQKQGQHTQPASVPYASVSRLATHDTHDTHDTHGARDTRDTHEEEAQ